MKKKRRIILLVILLLITVVGICLSGHMKKKEGSAMRSGRKPVREVLAVSDEIKRSEPSEETESSLEEDIATEEEASSLPEKAAEEEISSLPEKAAEETISSLPETVTEEESPVETVSSEVKETVESAETSESAACTHEWVDIVETVEHPEQGHYEEIVLQEEWDEIRDIVEFCRTEKCRCRCGALFDTDLEWEMHSIEHADDEEDIHDSFTVTYIDEEVITGQETIHHDAVTQTVWVIDQAAYSKEVVVGQICRICGSQTDGKE
ncbi:MAG: hypothetical protein J5589_13160 [Firmicutes bacterium]|nr:hypothetical protein [Bacillota bacterium]